MYSFATYFVHLLFFFLMIRRPPRSTLFPTRRSSDLAARFAGQRAAQPPPSERYERRMRCFPERSEEHTSELQSRLHLVCRLLLEKKKKKIDPALTVHTRPKHRDRAPMYRVPTTPQLS